MKAVPLQNANIAAGMKGFLFRPLAVTSIPVEFSNSMRVASWLMCSVTFLALPSLLNSKHRPVSHPHVERERAPTPKDVDSLLKQAGFVS